MRPVQNGIWSTLDNTRKCAEFDDCRSSGDSCLDGERSGHFGHGSYASSSCNPGKNSFACEGW